MGKKLPPFARQIICRRPGGSESIRVYTGANAWSMGKAWAKINYPTVVLPPDAAPDAFDWSFAHGWTVLVVDTGNTTPLDHLHRLGVLLVQAGATHVVVATSQAEAERGLVYQPARERMAA